MSLDPRSGDPIAGIQRDLARADRGRASFVRTAAASVAVVLVVAVALAAVVGSADPAEKPPAPRVVAPAIEPSASAGVAAPSIAEAPTPASPAEEPTEQAAPAPEAAEAGPAPKPKPKLATKPATQRISIGIGAAGYEPAVVTARAGAPIELTVGQGEGCAAGFLIPSLGISADNSQGPVVIRLPALSAGKYRFSCGMDMVSGTLVVR